MKVRKAHALPTAAVVAVFAAIQNWMQLRGPETAIVRGLGTGTAAGIFVWFLAQRAERKSSAQHELSE